MVRTQKNVQTKIIILILSLMSLALMSPVHARMKSNSGGKDSAVRLKSGGKDSAVKRKSGGKDSQARIGENADKASLAPGHAESRTVKIYNENRKSGKFIDPSFNPLAPALADSVSRNNEAVIKGVNE